MSTRTSTSNRVHRTTRTSTTKWLARSAPFASKGNTFLLLSTMGRYTLKNLQVVVIHIVVHSSLSFSLSSSLHLNDRCKIDRSPMNQKRIAELEAQVATLKDDRAELYKTQGTNAQRLLDLNDILRVKDANLAQGKEE